MKAKLINSIESFKCPNCKNKIEEAPSLRHQIIEHFDNGIFVDCDNCKKRLYIDIRFEIQDTRMGNRKEPKDPFENLRKLTDCSVFLANCFCEISEYKKHINKKSNLEKLLFTALKSIKKWDKETK
jgi:hypothetical protein